MQDRYEALRNVNYVFNIAREFGKNIEFKKDGFITKRAQQVLDEAEAFLHDIKGVGLMDAISKGKFADIKRPIEGGKGLDGVFKKAIDYSNPIMEQLERKE